MEPETPAPPRPHYGGRQKGTIKTGGRKKGTPNKMTAQLKSLILGALSDVGGRDYLARQAIETPGPFLTLLGKILPTELTGKDGAPIQTESTIRGPIADRVHAILASEIAPGSEAVLSRDHPPRD